MKKFALLFILFWGVSNVYADEILTSKQVKIILADENQILPETKQLFSKGAFSKKSFISDAESYRGYYLANKKLNFMNFDVLAYQVIYFEIDVGCCVGSENSLILAPKINANLVGLKKFAKENKCEVESSSVVSDLPDEVSVKLISKAKTSRLFSLSCEVNR